MDPFFLSMLHVAVYMEIGSYYPALQEANNKVFGKYIARRVPFLQFTKPEEFITMQQRQPC